jgi:hypothetical protein
LTFSAHVYAQSVLFTDSGLTRDELGHALIAADVPSDPSFAGLNLYLQAVEVDRLIADFLGPRSGAGSHLLQ